MHFVKGIRCAHFVAVVIRFMLRVSMNGFERSSISLSYITTITVTTYTNNIMIQCSTLCPICKQLAMQLDENTDQEPLNNGSVSFDQKYRMSNHEVLVEVRVTTTASPTTSPTTSTSPTNAPRRPWFAIFPQRQREDQQQQQEETWIPMHDYSTTLR